MSGNAHPEPSDAVVERVWEAFIAEMREIERADPNGNPDAEVPDDIATDMKRCIRAAIATLRMTPAKALTIAREYRARMFDRRGIPEIGEQFRRGEHDDWPSVQSDVDLLMFGDEG